MVREFRRGPLNKYDYVTLAPLAGGLVRTTSGTNQKDDPPKDVDEAAAEKLVTGLLKKGYVEVVRDRYAKSPVVDLAPGEWRFATWRAPAPVPPPEPRPFDREVCLAALRGVTVRPYDWDFISVYPPAMTPLEATFWHAACARVSPNTRPDGVASELAAMPFDEPLALEKLPRWPATWERAPLIATLLGPDAFMEFVLREEGLVPTWLLRTLVDRVLPYLTEEHVERWRARLRPAITPDRWPEDNGKPPPREYYVAALLGMSRELGAVVERWPDGRYAPPPKLPWTGSEPIKAGLPYLVVYGLESGERVKHQIERLGIRCFSYWGQCDGWLAHTETRGFEYLKVNVVGRSGPDLQKRDPGQARYGSELQLVHAFGKVHDRALSPWMVSQLGGWARGAARVWLLENDPRALDEALARPA